MLSIFKYGLAVILTGTLAASGALLSRTKRNNMEEEERDAVSRSKRGASDIQELSDYSQDSFSRRSRAYVNEANYEVFKWTCDSDVTKKSDADYFKDCYSIQDLRRWSYHNSGSDLEKLKHDLNVGNRGKSTVPVLRMTDGKWYVIDEKDYKYIKPSTQNSQIWIWTKWNAILRSKYKVEEPTDLNNWQDNRSYKLWGRLDKKFENNRYPKFKFSFV